MTVTETPAVARAVETSDQVASHLHPEGSFDVDAHPVPTGREEIWRFTPLKRLRGLHQDADLTGGAPARRERGAGGCHRRALERDSALRGSSGYVPTDRVARPGVARTPDVAWAVTVPRRPSSSEPVLVTLTGDGGRDGHRDAHRGHRQGAQPVDGRAALRGLRGAGRATSRSWSATARTSRSWSWPGLGRRRGAPQQPARQGRPRRDAAARRRVVRRRPGPAQRLRGVRRPGRRGRDAGAVLRRRRPAPRAPAVRRPQRAEDPEQRGLQGRAAGRGRARRVDRRRADPQGRRGHRDLRVQPQPGAHRRLPGRLGPEPRDRDRRDRGRRPRLHDRPLRRPAAVLPAVARHPRGRGAPAGRARLLRRHHPQDRRARRSRSSCSRPSRRSWRRTSPRRPRWCPHDLHPRLRRRRRRARLGARRSTSTAPTWPSCATATTGTPSPTSARTRRSRCPRATSRAARSSAGCTARASTCAPASRPARRPPSRSPSTPSRSTGDDVLVDVTAPLNSVD